MLSKPTNITKFYETQWNFTMIKIMNFITISKNKPRNKIKFPVRLPKVIKWESKIQKAPEMGVINSVSLTAEATFRFGPARNGMTWPGRWFSFVMPPKFIKCMSKSLYDIRELVGGNEIRAGFNLINRQLFSHCTRENKWVVFRHVINNSRILMTINIDRKDFNAFRASVNSWYQILSNWLHQHLLFSDQEPTIHETDPISTMPSPP